MLGWDAHTRSQEIEAYRARAEAEDAAAQELDDAEAVKVRLRAADVSPMLGDAPVAAGTKPGSPRREGIVRAGRHLEDSPRPDPRGARDNDVRQKGSTVEFTIGDAFVSELMGTAMLVLLGTGVVANVILPKNKGFDGGWLLINFGWGLAVFSGVYVAYKSGAHLNPAVTMGIWTSGAEDFAPGIPVTAANGFLYVTAQMVGAAIGALVCFLAYKKHFDEDADAGAKLAVFSTGPAIRSYAWNFITEVIGTFVLVFVILCFAQDPRRARPARRRTPRGRYRRQPRWSDGLRHQPCT